MLKILLAAISASFLLVGVSQAGGHGGGYNGSWGWNQSADTGSHSSIGFSGGSAAYPPYMPRPGSGCGCDSSAYTEVSLGSSNVSGAMVWQSPGHTEVGSFSDSTGGGMSYSERWGSADAGSNFGGDAGGYSGAWASQYGHAPIPRYTP